MADGLVRHLAKDGPHILKRIGDTVLQQFQIPEEFAVIDDAIARDNGPVEVAEVGLEVVKLPHGIDNMLVRIVSAKKLED